MCCEEHIKLAKNALENHSADVGGMPLGIWLFCFLICVDVINKL